MIKNDSLTEKIIFCAYKAHTLLGPGFHERIYHEAIKHEFKNEKLEFISERLFKVRYQNEVVGNLRVDLIVNNCVIVEVKAITGYIPKVFESQLLAYLKISGLTVGLLINFGNRSCLIRRIVRKENLSKKEVANDMNATIESP